MKVLISINQKGGVGKTTTAANVGFRLSQLGKKVLLIDGDEQANLSLIFNATKHKETLFKLFITGEAVKPYEINPNLYIIPSDVRTSNINVQLANDVNAPFFLKKYLAMPEYKDYDIAIIDCAPALDAIIINAITAGDAMLISLSPGEFSYDGMRRILSASNTIKKNYGAKIQLGGIILSMINARTRFTNKRSNYYGRMIFSLMRSTRISAYAKPSNRQRPNIKRFLNSHRNRKALTT